MIPGVPCLLIHNKDNRCASPVIIIVYYYYFYYYYCVNSPIYLEVDAREKQREEKLLIELN